MLIRNYSETRPHASHAHAPENMYIVRPQYEYGIYKVTQSSQQSLPGYSCPAGHGVFTVITPPRTTTFNAVLPCCITQSWGVQLVTKNDGVKWNTRPILHWSLTHYYTACMFHAHFMHYTESDHQKLGGTNTLLVPPTKRLGGACLPRSPWLLRLWWQLWTTSFVCGCWTVTKENNFSEDCPEDSKIGFLQVYCNVLLPHSACSESTDSVATDRGPCRLRPSLFDKFTDSQNVYVYLQNDWNITIGGLDIASKTWPLVTKIRYWSF